MSLSSVEREGIRGEIIELTRKTTELTSRLFIVPTDKTMNELMTECNEASERMRHLLEELNLSRAQQRDFLISKFRELLEEELPAFHRWIYEHEINRLRSMDLRTREGKKELELAGDILAGKLIDLIKTDLERQIPHVIQEEFAKKPKEKVEKALEAVKRGAKGQGKRGLHDYRDR